MLQKNLKDNWVVMYGIEVYTPYGIDKCAIATYGFVSPTNHEGKYQAEEEGIFYRTGQVNSDSKVCLQYKL